MSKLFQRVETTFGSLLRELQQIWEEMGESEADIDKTLAELEQECLQVYRRKVEQVSQSRAKLHQTLAEREAELAGLYAVLGERPAINSKTENKTSTLKAQLATINPQVEELRSKKEERVKQFREVKSQIEKISNEISGTPSDSASFAEEEDNLSIRKLEDYRTHLQSLQKEKSERLHKVLNSVNTLHGLCSVLGMDFAKTVNDVHPSLNDVGVSLQPKSISNETIETLSNAVQTVTEEKKQRIQTLSGLLSSLTELWKLMDTPLREQRLFRHMTINGEITTPGGLSLDTIELVREEVQKLEKLKASKMKELVLKKRMVLEHVCRQAHMEPDASTAPDKTNAMIDSGMVDAAELLDSLEEQILKAQQEAESRKEILDRVDKWISACEEERWLEDYNMDENRYAATRGAHLNLKRAERARITVTKLPALVDALINKTRSWEEEKGICFLFDGLRLLSMLDDYIYNRHQREEEKRRMKDQKRLQDQMLTHKEVLFGSRPSPTKPMYSKRGSYPNTPSTPSTPRRVSMIRPGTPDSTPRSNGHRNSNPFGRTKSSNGAIRPSAPLNFVAMHNDTASVFSAGGSDSSSPLGSTLHN